MENKIALALVLSLIVVTAGAFLLNTSAHSAAAASPTITYGDFTFSFDGNDLNGDGAQEVTLIAYSKNAQSVTIPDSITVSIGDTFTDADGQPGVVGTDPGVTAGTYYVTAVADYGGISAPVFYHKNNIQTLTIGAHMLKIGSNAFNGCTSLTVLNLQNVTDVGESAFYHCPSLTSITGNSVISIGNYAFSVASSISGAPYTDPIATISVLSLPVVKTIGVAAFGVDAGNPSLTSSLARNFSCSVSLNSAVTISDYAFAGSAIPSLSLASVQTIGAYAFWVPLNSDSSSGYGLNLQNIVSIGDSAFYGRAVKSFTTSPTNAFTIGTNAFYGTQLATASLGMVSSIGSAAFDSIPTLQWFSVNSDDAKYASIQSKNPNAKGLVGALYSLNSAGNPDTLIKLPSGIDTAVPAILANNKFTVADGVTSMANSAFIGCPAISVDLNDITSIPTTAFANSGVTSVSAEKVKTIGVSAFSGCTSLSSFEFISTGPLNIKDLAFTGTSLNDIELPKGTTIGSGAFSYVTGSPITVGIWGDTVAEPDSFEGTKIFSLTVSSDATLSDGTQAGANALYATWNSNGWKYCGSNQVPRLIVDNQGGSTVDISAITTQGVAGGAPVGSQLGILNGFTNIECGDLQFVEYKELSTGVSFHMVSVKAGIYIAEAHGSASDQQPVQQNMIDDTQVGTCYSGDGITWEINLEFYYIEYYSFPSTSADHTDPNYTNPDLTTSNLISDRSELIGTLSYLSGTKLGNNVMWPDYIQYGLVGWYTGNNPNPPVGDPLYVSTLTAPITLGTNTISSPSHFDGILDAFQINQSWIYRDPVTDQGTLFAYALFSGKQYSVDIASQVTGGQNSAHSSAVTPSTTGGKVTLTLSVPIDGISQIDTSNGGKATGSYPYGTVYSLTATPNTGYAFVGWEVIPIDSSGDPGTPLCDVWSDRSYVNAADVVAEWPDLALYSHLMFVANFAPIIAVTFNSNDGSASTTVNFVAGDNLVESNNDYNGFDYNYEAKFTSTADSAYSGNGTSYCPSIPTQTDLTYGGWYSGTTAYALYDGTDLTNLIPTPSPTASAPTLTLMAKWYAEITFYPNNGVNTGAFMPSVSGLTETTAGSGIYKYKLDVGTYAGTGYNIGLPDTIVPAVTGVNFNGWYVLSGGTGISSIEASVIPNVTANYKDVYPTDKRFEIPSKSSIFSSVQGNMSLIALYSADVSFYFNGATLDTALMPNPIPTASPYVVTVPASLSTPLTLGNVAFNDINTDMQNANTTGGIYKLDALDQREYFINWYESVDGTTLPVATDTIYGSSTQITQNVYLIAGWGYSITFTDSGVSGGTIMDSGTQWDPSAYGFRVLEGTEFQMGAAGMPSGIKLNGTSPTAWYDSDSTPYNWFMDTTPPTDYTYSVKLTPEFSELFVFNMMGGTPGIVSVGYSSTETFSDVLNKLYAQLYDSGTSQYTVPTKTGLYYKSDGSTIGSDNKPSDIVWYTTSTHDSVWSLSDSCTTKYAYIRWMADVSFNVNVPAGETGTSGNPATITVDEGTPFTSLTPTGMLTVPHYNSANNKTFTGWFDITGTTKYAGADGTIVSGTDVTSSITLYAMWGVQVKFYYAADSVTKDEITINAGAGSLGSDGSGYYVIVTVANDGIVTAPTMARTGFAAAPSYLWFGSGFGSSDIPLAVDQITPSSALLSSPTSSIFDPNSTISVNTTVYANWYATVKFTVGGGTNSFFTQTTKYLLEGSKLSEQGQDLDPYIGDIREQSPPAGDGWKFIGWYDQTTTPSGYEDLGVQYYTTGFDYMQNSSPPSDTDSVPVTKDVTLNFEYVVLVNFDPNYAGATAIQAQYLRVGHPLPSSGDPRFTAMPARTGVVSMGWYNLVTKIRYTNGDISAPDTPDMSMNIMGSMTLTAAWQVTVSFDNLPVYLSNGLILNVDGVRITQDLGPDGILNTLDDIFLMPEGTTLRELIGSDPSISGMEFISWFVASSPGVYTSGDTLYGLNSQFMEDTVLTAGYGYTVHFDTNGGTPSAIPDVLVIQGQSISLPESPAKGRMTFEGWDDGTGSLSAARTSVAPGAETTYTAKWLVVVTLYDGISMKPIATMQWDDDVGPGFTSSDYSTTTNSDYNNKVTEVGISWTDAAGTHNVTLNKFIDEYDNSANDWVTLYSVFSGWIDPLTGTLLTPTANLYDWLMSNTDSAALFATWQERLNFYGTGGSVTTSYVDTGSYLGAVAPSGGSWANKYTPTMPLNSDTYRITNSMDLTQVQFITVTFNGNGGSPSTQVFNVVSGTMVGAVGAQDPTRSGMYFAGWYDGNTKCSFTDILYSDTTLTAKWSSTQVQWYTIFAFAYDNASITPAGMIKAMQGDTLTFNYNAGMGYTPIVKVDGQDIADTSSLKYIFYSISSDHSIEISAVNSGVKNATSFLTVNINGKGSVLYSTDGGNTFLSYSSPLPIYDGVDYTLRAIPGTSSYFDHWSGDESGSDPQLEIMPASGSPNMTVTANFGSSTGGGSGTGFGGGQLAILNLICMVLAILIGIVAIMVTYKRNYEGTGTGKAMRFGALLVAVISLVIFLLTEGFSGSYVIHDSWTIVMFLLLVCVVVLALASVRHDYNEAEKVDAESSGGTDTEDKQL